jgi:RNA-binding protein YhbY
MKTYEMVRKEDCLQSLADERAINASVVGKLKKEKKELADQLYKWTGFAQLMVKGTEFTITKDTLDMLNRMGYVKKGE